MLASFRTGSINSEYKTSGFCSDTLCALCKDEERLQAVRYCTECEQFICKKCVDLHKCLSTSSKHAFMQDLEMSESKLLGTYMVIRHGSLSVKLKDDSKDCCITGIAITEDGRIILADFENRTLKMFRQNMLFINSLRLLYQPWDIAVLSDQEIVVSMSGKQLAFIDISADQISITNTLRLQFDIYGVALYKDKLVVTSMTSGNLKIPSVKLIDKTGEVQWTVTLSQRGKQLFVWPMYVGVLNHNMTAYVIVTDSGNSTLTLLRADTGAFIKRSWLDMSKEPQCIATDSQNILMTYIGTNEIVAMSKDLNQSRVLLTRRRTIGMFGKATSEYCLDGKVWAIGYDKTTKQLIVSYENRNILDVYVLTKGISKPFQQLSHGDGIKSNTDHCKPNKPLNSFKGMDSGEANQTSSSYISSEKTSILTGKHLLLRGANSFLLD